jgi:hypothetical protein
VEVYEGSNILEVGLSIKVDTFSNVYIAGQTINDFNDYLAVKYTSNGAQQWVAIYDGNYNDNACCMEIDNSGNIYISGSNQRSNYDWDYNCKI